MPLKQSMTLVGILALLSGWFSSWNESFAEDSVQSIPQKTSRKDHDEYTAYVDSIDKKKIIPPFVYGIDKQFGCDREKLEREHRETQCILDCKLNEKGGRGHGIGSFLRAMVLADTNLANCFYKPGSKEHKERIEDIITHYELVSRPGSAGRMYYYLHELTGESRHLERAIQYLRRDTWGDGFESYLKLTPKENLPKARDEYLQQGDHLRAGKIEWYLGNRERGRELILQSKEFPLAVEESRKAVQEKEYSYAIGNLWRGLRIPFTTEIINDICKNNRACLKDLKRHGPHRDQEFRTYLF